MIHTTHRKSNDRRLTIFPKFGIFHWMRDQQNDDEREVSQQWECGGYALHYLVRAYGKTEAMSIIREERKLVEVHKPNVQRGKKVSEEEEPEPAEEMCV
jgi:hypothetical protein